MLMPNQSCFRLFRNVSAVAHRHTLASSANHLCQKYISTRLCLFRKFTSQGPVWASRTLVRSICRNCLQSNEACLRKRPEKGWRSFAVSSPFRKAAPNNVKPVARSGTKATTIPKTSEVKRLLTQARPEKWRILGGVGLLLVSSGVTMAVPFCMGKVIDIIYTASDHQQLIERLNTVCLALVAVFVLGGLANFGRVYLMQISGQRIIRTLREKLFSSVMRQEMAFFDKTKTGELINRLSTDTSLVGQSVTMNISDGLRAIAQAVGGVSMMVYVSTKLTLFSLGVVPPVAVMSVVYGRYMKSITRQVQDSLADATQLGEERISNIRTVRAFAHEERECAAYRQKIQDVLSLSYKESLARGIFFGLTGLSGNLIVLSVFYHGGMMMTESQITVGELSAFLLYAAYVGISIGGMSSFYTELNRGLGASQRLWELLDRVPAIPVSAAEQGPGQSLQSLPSVQGNIEFRDIHFAYPARPDVAIFKGLNLQVKAGQVTAVVGPSGSGKSTICGLLLRYYDPDAGEVTLDGQDISTLDPTWLRSHVGTVSQEPILFSCSVAENIAYGAVDPRSVTLQQIEGAARKANAYNFVSAFPRGLDTLVGERGMMLSGGQRQRIAIARAILKNPEILMLDEATSALDAESEFLVQDALETLMAGRTVLTIAHRLSTIKTANQIAVLSDGGVAEMGPYGDLMAIEGGIFRKLVERQTIVS
ncbi:ATP-binding cassette sub-family B member 10, mitochondrial-like [Babylonia areolata]|uniref:ATP-binding cassette sub-family B member 10, mitochondrial-like n=1 Tax=Babylonia areolata TaxID=304850 RepID=UPI003FD66E43